MSVFKRLPSALGALTAALLACGEPPSAPRIVEGLYHAGSANGHRMPVQVDRFTTTSGTICACELTAAALMLNGGDRFDFVAGITTTCGDEVSFSEDRASGTYVRRGEALDLVPLYQGTAVVDRASFSDGGLLVTVTRNSGATYTLAMNRYPG